MPSRLRIVGGRFRGRQLSVPDGKGTRPTTDRVREALFNILEHRDPPVLAGATVLDLFAGTGALGLEALSRGAEQSIFVEADRQASDVIRHNIDLLQLADACRIIRLDATRLGDAPVAADLVFCDAPYGRGLTQTALERAMEKGWIAAGATMVIELAAGEDVDLPDGLTIVTERTYGAAKIAIVI